MPLIQLVSTGDVPKLRDRSGALLPVLAENLEAQPLDTPVVILIHGFRYDAAKPENDPAKSIFSPVPPADDPRSVSWPRHLGFCRGRTEEGLCIGLSWPARTGIREAYQRANEAGVSLARLVDLIRFADPRREVVVVAHSLGARVALCALPHIKAGRIHRMVFIYGAEIGRETDHCLSTGNYPLPRIINVTSRENWIIDCTFAAAITRRPWTKTLSSCTATRCAEWIDLPLHDPNALALLRAAGYPISQSLRPICHWSGYLRPGVFTVYRDFVRSPDKLPLDGLRRLADERRDSRRALRPRIANLIASILRVSRFGGIIAEKNCNERDPQELRSASSGIGRL